MLKSCRYCGRIHDSKILCDRKPKLKRKTNYNEAIRYTAVMTKKSKEIKEKALYLCEVCYSKNIITYMNLETHHIKRLVDFPELALEDLNLVCLCRSCHEKAEKGAINQQFLIKLAKKREKASPPAI